MSHPTDFELKNILGPQKANVLKKLSIHTLRDLLWHLPARYEDRTRFTPITEAKEGETLTFRGKIIQSRSVRWRGGRRVFEAWVSKSENVKNPKEALRGMWFNMPYLSKILARDKEIILHGKVKMGKQSWVMVHPEFELIENNEEANIHLNRITPVYPLTEGLPQRALRRILFELTQQIRNPDSAPHFLNSDSPTLKDLFEVPQEMQPLREALPSVHFPKNWEEIKIARSRLVYEEFFVLQSLLIRRRQRRERIHKNRPKKNFTLYKKFLSALEFTPTSAQHRTISEINNDLINHIPMNRLLQGDVGSGKTIVATSAILMAIEQGQYAAFMAPTEILAEQHWLNLKKWLEPLGISVGLHTGSRKLSDRSPLDKNTQLEKLFKHKGSVTVGTHALLFDSFISEKLGLIVIDEQHKFGVMQRLRLSEKGCHPDTLVMTATPIPRTLAMTLYGDLDVSIIDELPPGRGKIITAVRSNKDLPKVWKFAKSEVEAGRQAYVVYPLVDASEKIQAKSVQAEFENLEKLFSPHSVALLHGRMKPKDKASVMTDFRQGKVKVLVSTTVIEVGVDVANATMMIIENAERFGLAQLHQLRGRIGRGSHKSYCVLVGTPKNLESWQRLKILENSNDGFRVAEEDLKIRGPGNVLGTEQSGLPPLLLADPLHDFELLAQARNSARLLLQKDPGLDLHPLFLSYLERMEVQRPSTAIAL